MKTNETIIYHITLTFKDTPSADIARHDGPHRWDNYNKSATFEGDDIFGTFFLSVSERDRQKVSEISISRHNRKTRSEKLAGHWKRSAASIGEGGTELPEMIRDVLFFEEATQCPHTLKRWAAAIADINESGLARHLTERTYSLESSNYVFKGKLVWVS